MKNTLAQVVLIVITATVLAIGGNLFASRERKLAMPGWWPNATKVPVQTTEPPPPVAGATTTTGTATAAPTTTTQDRPEAGATPTTTTTTVSEAKPAVVPPPQEAKAPAPAPPRADVSRFTPHPDRAYVEVGGDDVMALHAAGALFLDARRSSVFRDGHIAGARSFSVWEADVDDKVNALYGERSDPAEQNKPIVIYCSGGACEDSHMLAQKLWGIQFNNLYVYKDGFPDWQKRGGAVRTGENP